MKIPARILSSKKTFEHLDRRLATNHLLRRAIVASGTTLGALSYLLLLNAAR